MKMKLSLPSVAFLSAIALATPSPAVSAATISLGASDTGAQSSYAAGTNWTGGAAPIAGTDYLVGGGLTLQTPADATTDVFAGSSLTIGDGGATAATLVDKGNNSASVLTIGSLILNNGIIQVGSSAGPTIGPAADTITLMNGGGIIDTHGASNSIIITSVITGSGPLLLENSLGGTPGSGIAGITIKGSNTYTGATTIGTGAKVTAGGGNAFLDSSSLTINSGGILAWNTTGTLNNLGGTGTVSSSLTSGGATMTINQTVDGTFGGSFAFTGSGSGTFNLTKTGAATLTLTGASTWAASTGTSALSVVDGAVKLDGSTGSLSSTLALKMNGGTFAFDNTSSTGAKAQSFSALTFGLGDNVIQSILGGATSSTLTFGATTIPPVTGGASVNFVTSGGANGTTNSIVLTGAAAGFMNQAAFFDGADYAYVDPAGYARAAVYGSDSGFVNATTALSAASHNRMASSIAGQGAVAVNTIKFDGASEVDLGLTGALTLANNGLLRSGGGATVVSGGSIVAGSTGNYFFRADTAADSLTISSAVQNASSGTTGLVKSGAGTLTLGGVNTYLGTTTLDGGVVSVSQNANLGAETTGASLVFNNGTLQATSTFGLYQGSAGTHNRAVNIANNATFDVTGSNTLTIAGAVSNNGTFVGSLIKSDTGTLVLSGTNAYTGTTTVNGGTLLVNGSLAAGSAVTVNSAAILGGTGTINGALTLASGGAIAPGVIGAIGTLNGTSFVWNGGGALDFDLGSGTSSDVLNLTGAFTKGGAGAFTFDFNALGSLVAGTTYTLVDFGSTTFSVSDFLASGASGTFSMNAGNLQFTVAAVPEPGTYALVALGGAVLLLLPRRRRSAVA